MSYGPPSIQEIDDLQVRWDYASTTVRYQGHASPGAAEGAASWRIKKMTLDTSGRLVKTEFADGNGNFDNVWTDRAGLSYS